MMKCFIWDRIEKCSDNYHTEGGLIIVAIDEARARQIADTIDGVCLLEDELPDKIITVSDDESEYSQIFIDAGCC